MEGGMSLTVPAPTWRAPWIVWPLVFLTLWVVWLLTDVQVLVWRSNGPGYQNQFIVRCVYLGPTGLSTRENRFSFEFFTRLYACPNWQHDV